jgi:hypothetical protein
MGKPTEEEIAKIEAMLLSRRYSGAAIAKALGLPGSVPEPLAKGAEKRYASAERRLRWQPQRPGDPPRPLTLVRLERTQCKYPVGGEGENTLFCGAVRLGESSYCDKHYALCHTQPRRLTVAG